MGDLARPVTVDCVKKPIRLETAYFRVNLKFSRESLTVDIDYTMHVSDGKKVVSDQRV